MQEKNSYNTYLWKEERNQPFYRIQTDDPEYAKKLRRRTTFKLAGYGINTTLWIFMGKYSTLQKAKISLQRLTGQKSEKDSNTGGFKAVTYPLLDA